MIVSKNLCVVHVLGWLGLSRSTIQLGLHFCRDLAMGSGVEGAGKLLRKCYTTIVQAKFSGLGQNTILIEYETGGPDC